jgi:hypothetical protein
MADWILIACLVKLRAEFDALAPGRGKASDGSIGDAAHKREVSDHNDDETGSVPIHDADHVDEVHAIDVDVDLRTPGLSMETVVQFLLGRCRSGAEKRLRYIIYNRRIWEASNGWRRRHLHRRQRPHRARALLRVVRIRTRSLDGFLAPGGNSRGTHRAGQGLTLLDPERSHGAAVVAQPGHACRPGRVARGGRRDADPRRTARRRTPRRSGRPGPSARAAGVPPQRRAA